MTTELRYMAANKRNAIQRRLMPNMGLPPSGAAANHSS